MPFCRNRPVATVCLLTCFIASVSTTCSTTKADDESDWPQWRGPDRTGIAESRQLISQWPENGPRLLWRNEGVGRGYSSLAVVGDRIYTMGDIDGEQCVVAVSRSDGTRLWKTSIGAQHEGGYGGARCTPTISDGLAYVLSTDGVLVCVRTEDGQEVWRKDLASEYNAVMAAGNDYEWRFSESPLVDGDRVIITPGSLEALVVALDKKNGREIWRTRGEDIGENGADGAAYSSCVISNAAGVKQYVTLTGRGAVGVSARDGSFLWGYNRIANKVANIPTPLVSGDYVFVSTGYGTGAALLEISRRGRRFNAREVYFLQPKQMQNHHGGMILHEGHIYAGSGHGRGYPVCLDLQSGDSKWERVRNEGTGSAAISMADGHLYFRYQNGLLVLIEATPEGYREKGAFMIPDVEDNSWSHPVIAGGRLYLREQNNTFCYDLTPTDPS